MSVEDRSLDPPLRRRQGSPSLPVFLEVAADARPRGGRPATPPSSRQEPKKRLLYRGSCREAPLHRDSSVAKPIERLLYRSSYIEAHIVAYTRAYRVSLYLRRCSLECYRRGHRNCRAH